MKSVFVVFALICFAMGVCVADPCDTKTRATKLVAMLAKEDYKAVIDQFDSNMRSELSAEKLKLVWTSLIAQVGQFENQVSIRTEDTSTYCMVFVGCKFAKLTADVKVVFDGKQQVSGLFVVPHEQEADASAPLYAKPDKFCETKVTVGTGEWLLPGKLTLPKGKGPFPAVVLVQGSGPADMDETIVANKPFRDLAWGLASCGIAVLRYDKRTMVYGAMMASMQSITVNDETVYDVLDAVRLLRKTSGIDSKRVFVLGHSLGGMMLPRIGKADHRIAGLIMLAGSARPFEESILEQLEYISSIGGEISDDQKARINTVKQQIERLKDPELSPTSLGSILGAPPSYWLDLRGYDPPKVAKCLRQPMLILQGERDYQVTTKDFDLWKKSLSCRNNVQFKLYPCLNHLFISGTGKSTPSEYENAGHVDEQVIRDVACWINKH